MTKQISPNDWQTLSEYLDGQLSNRERVQIEARLQTSEDLRSGLEEIRRTRAILRTLPKRRAPRNFILTPAMVPQRRAALPRAFPYLRLASALASVLLVITFLSDLAIHTGPSAATFSANAPVQAPAAIQSAPNPYPQPNAAAGPAATEAPAAPAAPPAAPAPNLAAQPTESPTGEVMRSMAAAAPTEDATQQAMAAMTAAPAGKGGAETNPAATTEPATGAGATEALPQHFAQRLQSPTPAAAQDTYGPAQAQPNLKANPGAEPPQTVAEPNPPFELTSLLRPAEILLAIIAVLTGLAAYIVYRAGRT